MRDAEQAAGAVEEAAAGRARAAHAVGMAGGVEAERGQRAAVGIGDYHRATGRIVGGVEERCRIRMGDTGAKAVLAIAVVELLCIN